MALCVAVAIPACRRGDEPPAQDARSAVIYDLVDELPSAEISTNTTLIDFGTPESTAHLIAGWGAPEQIPAGPVVWAMGPRSSFWFFTTDRRPIRMACRLRPYLYADDARQTATPIVNGHRLPTIELVQRPETYSVAIPADAVVAGKNRVDVEYGYSGKPSQNGEAEKDGRPLAVLWQWARFDLPKSQEPPRSEGDTIVLPPGTAVTYFVKLPEDASFHFAELATDGGGPPRTLVLRVRTDGMKEDRRVDLDVPAPNSRSLPLGTVGITRVSLSSPPVEPGAAGGGVEVRAPVIAAKPIGAPTPPPAAAPPERTRANVVIFLIDTMRADHLGVYGYERATSPNIDAFSKDAVTFDNAIAQTSWTRPAVASVLTGLSMRSHGIVGMKTALPASVVTIAEVLQSQGYDTAAYTRNAQVSRETGFDQGFDHFELVDGDPEFDDVVRRALGEDARPFFYYLHTVEPHAPYAAEEAHRRHFADGIDLEVGTLDHVRDLGSDAFTTIFNRNFTAGGTSTRPERDEPHPQRAELIDLYDAEIATADARFGRFLEALRGAGSYENTIVVLLADHGEELYDHGRLSHGMTLYRELTRVPLLIKFPHDWSAGRRVVQRVSQIDVLPTVLDYLGIDVPDAAEGRSLLPVLNGTGSADAPPSFSYLDWFGGHAESVEADGFKLIHNLEMGPLLHPKHELYDLRADPRERVDLAASMPVTTAYLASLIKRSRQARGHQYVPEEAPILDPAFRERMRALGYVE
jgi:arylsulfatase A-like enzyme